MLIKEKEEYLKFMILIKLRYNIGLCRIRLENMEELTKNNPYNSTFNYKHEDTLDFYNENIRIARELFNVNITDDLNPINNEICNQWPPILEYLKSKICDYEWTIQDFEDTKYYDIYEYITSYDLYWEMKRTKKDTDPIYFEFSRLKILDEKFANIFKEIIDNGLFNPNKRTVNGSYEPFWAIHLPYDGNLTDLYEKIIFDKRCNYRMIKNGTDMVLLYLRMLTGFFGNYDLSETQKQFSLNFIYKIIKDNNCSILQEYVDDTDSQSAFILEDPLIFILFANEENLTMYDEFVNLYKYCISEDGVINQCKALEHKTEGCSKAIDFYISLIEKDNHENKEGIKQLKKLSNYTKISL